MISLATLIERWAVVVPRMTVGLILSALVAGWIARRWPEIPAEQRHRLWCGVMAVGLLWFTIPVTHIEFISAPAAVNPRAPSASVHQVSAGPVAQGNSLAGEDSLAHAFGHGAGPTTPRWDATRAIFALWVLGVLGLSAMVAGCYVRFLRRLSRDSRHADVRVQTACAVQARRLGLAKAPEVRLFSACEVPFVFGLVRPTVYLPETLAVDERQRDALLAHELAHVRRHDAWIELASLSACILNFFNPAVWWARRRLAEAREQCADRAVVQSARHAPGVYAQALLHVAESLSAPTHALALSSGGSASELRTRIDALLSAARRETTLPARLALTVIVLAALVSLVTIHRQSVVVADEPVRSNPAANRPDLPDPNELALVADDKLTKLIQAIPYRDEELTKGLKYLANLQREDGSLGPEGHGQNVGVIGLTGLAFVAAGGKPNEGEYRTHIQRAIAFVCNRAGDRGYIVSQKSGSMYDHGYALLFLARVYPMVKDNADLKKTIEQAVKLTVASQCQDGSWRYQPTVAAGGDLTMGVCQIAALEAARQAGFAVPDETFKEFAGFLSQAQTNDGSYRYTLGGGEGSLVRTGVGLYAGHITGAGKEELQRGLKCLEAQRVPLDTAFRMYGQWYAAQAMRRIGGEKASAWYRQAAEEICRAQADDGSWNESNSPMLGTALACLMLASPVFEATGKK